MLKPLKNKILIERDARKKFTESGLTIPELAQETEVFGTVLAIGSEVQDVVVGDRVLFGKHDGFVVDPKIIGREGEYIIVRDEAVRAIIENV